MRVNDLTFTCTDGIWTLADDPDYALTQSSVRKMAGTILENADRVDHHCARC